jgi:hypothetical protein
MALLSILENLLPVKFSFSEETDPKSTDEILFRLSGEPGATSEASVGSFSLPKDGPISGESAPAGIIIQFSDDPEVPFPFRGRSVRTQATWLRSVLSLSLNEKLLASCEFGPVWTLSEDNGVKHFRSAFALPVIPENGSLRDALNERRFIEMIPMVHWLRQICAGDVKEASSLNACFIFDDPNLHWPSYGFADYRELAVRAEKENYHVSFATIPLDTWFTHRETANIFRNNPKRLSLLIHGNDHTKQELAQSYSEPERMFLLRQAIERIERLERRTGLAVSRVMVPPHGACSEEMLQALPICGFEGACISHGSLRAHNESREWTRTLGFRPFERVLGCPVFPRWAISGDFSNTVLLAAFFNQAIILRGHHQDLKGGVEILDESARFINGLGTVHWSNFTELSRLICQPQPFPMDTASGPPVTNGSIARDRSLAQASIVKVSAGRVPAAFVRRLLTEGRDRLRLTS